MKRLPKALALLLLLCLLPALGLSRPACLFKSWTRYRGDRLYKHVNKPAYFFVTSHVRIDADGAPNAYHPRDTGLDRLANAGYSSKPGKAKAWWKNVLVPDPSSPAKPYVQKSGKYKGFFVSKTTLQDEGEPLTSPSRYADSRSIPYVVFPGGFSKMAGVGAVGDLGWAFNLENGKKSPFVVAEIGPKKARLGEMSIALAKALGGKNPCPRTGKGAPKGRIAYLVFPGSSKTHPWPMTKTEIQKKAEKLLKDLGGKDAVRKCLRSGSGKKVAKK